MNPKRTAADRGNVVGVARMHHAIVIGRQTVTLCERVDVRRPHLIDDLIERTILGNDHQDMIIAWQFTGRQVDRRKGRSSAWQDDFFA